MRPPALLRRRSMNYIYPPEAARHKTYTGLVRTDTGLHKRILQRNSPTSDLPWLYWGSPEEGGRRMAADREISELEEVDPFINSHLRDTEKALDEARNDLDGAERVIHALQTQIASSPESLTEERVREIVREEVSGEDGDEGEPVRYAIKDSTDLLDEGVPSWRAEDLAAKITRMLMRTWEYEEDIRSRDYLPELTLKFEQDGNILTIEGDIRGVKR